ncbi:MAG: MFS transporter [Blastomonas sp.]
MNGMEANGSAPVWTQMSPVRRNVSLALIMVVMALSYIDRQVFTLFQDDIKVELGLDDGQLGLLTGMAFALFYALAAFPVARYADRGDRRLVIALSVTIWSIATAACGLAANFWQMLLARIGLAAGEAGAGPAGNSLLVEVFPPHRRTLVISTMLAASAVGLSGGLMLAGWLSNHFNWRTIFLIVGLPGIAIGLLVWLIVVEPRSGKGASASATPIPLAAGLVFRTMIGSASLRWVGLLLLTVPVSGFALILWGASFFRRVHQMPVDEVGFWLGTVMAVGLVLGNLLAGWVGDRFGSTNPRFNSWLAAFGLFAAFPFAILFCFAANPYVALAAFIAVKFLMTLHLGPIIALCFAQVPVTMRAMMSATINLFIGISGTGIGGTLGGFLSKAFDAAYGEQSLRFALAVTSVGLLIGGFAALMAGRTAKPLPENLQ